MSQDECSVGDEEIHVFILVEVLDPAASAALEEYRERVVCLDPNVRRGTRREMFQSVLIGRMRSGEVG